MSTLDDLPPIGLKPRRLIEEARMADVAAAIIRYVEAGYPLPQEWVDEYNEIQIAQHPYRKWLLDSRKRY